MTSFITRRSWTFVIGALLVLGAVAMVWAQESTRGNASNNGIPQQIAALQAQLAQAQAEIAALQESLAMESAARLEADTQLQDRVREIHLPQYLIEHGDQVPAEDLPPVDIGR